jgi:perosamine synthetase
MKVPLSITSLQKQEIKLISDSLKTGWLTHGKNNLIFEKKFSKYIGVKYSVSMNSCTSALECAVKLLKKKGEVIIPSWTWVSTANAVINAGCTPVFADIELNSRNIDPQEIKKKISRKTIAVIVVHFGGMPCEMSPIEKICKNRNIVLIEDSAETIGGTYKNKKTGSFGIGCFSFFPTKNITTTEGGMLTTNNSKYFNYVKKLIAHGIEKNKKFPWKREAILPGHNFRMPNHLAALGISQLKKLELFNKKRNKIANSYNEFFKKFPNIIEVQKVPKNIKHSYQMYTLRVKNNLRNSFLNFLNNNKIEASVHFYPPLHKQRYLSKFNKKKLKNTEILMNDIITLPMSPHLSQKQVRHVKNISFKWLKKFI